MKLLWHFFITALFFTIILPLLVPGIQVHGGIYGGFVCSILFVIAGWAVAFLVGLFTISTLGLALLLAWIFQILIPGLQLMLVASWAPSIITIDGWGSAIMGGICIFIINWYFTGKDN